MKFIRTLRGKTFRLTMATAGIEADGDHRKAVKIPANGIVTVVSGPRADDHRMVDVIWQGRKLSLFAEDIESRGEEASSESA